METDLSDYDLINPIRIRVRKTNFGPQLDVLICIRNKFGHLAIPDPSPLMFKDLEEGNFIEPTTQISRQAAQELMDELWDCGLRPSEGSGSAGAMLATQKHLEDMRSIVEKFTKVRFNNAG